MQAHYRLSVVDVRPLIELFKAQPDNTVGGNLHIYLDDGNVHDDHIKYCLNRCIERGDLLGEAICRLSLKLSRTQRLKLSKEFYD